LGISRVDKILEPVNGKRLDYLRTWNEALDLFRAGLLVVEAMRKTRSDRIGAVDQRFSDKCFLQSFQSTRVGLEGGGQKHDLSLLTGINGRCRLQRGIPSTRSDNGFRFFVARRQDNTMAAPLQVIGQSPANLSTSNK
jgi:hypothetical protein